MYTHQLKQFSNSAEKLEYIKYIQYRCTNSQYLKYICGRRAISKDYDYDRDYSIYKINVLDLLNLNLNIDIFPRKYVINSNYIKSKNNIKLGPLDVKYIFAIDSDNEIYLLNQYDNFKKLLYMKRMNDINQYKKIYIKVYFVKNKETAEEYHNSFNNNEKKKEQYEKYIEAMKKQKMIESLQSNVAELTNNN